MEEINLKLISEFKRKFTNGMQMYGFAPLKEEEIKFVKEEAKRINIDTSILRFNVNGHLERTCYDFQNDTIIVGRNIFPDEKYGGANPRDLLSVACVLAHEYYGHRLNREEYLYDAEHNKRTKTYWEDECRASITAAHITPNLTTVERSMLIQDARQRANDANQVLKMTSSMKRLLYGIELSTSEKQLTMPIAIVFYPKTNNVRNNKNRSGKSSLARMQKSSSIEDRGKNDYSL